MQLGIRARVAYFGWLRLDDIFAARGARGSCSRCAGSIVLLSSDKMEVQADVFRELGSGVGTENHVACCVAPARRGAELLWGQQTSPFLPATIVSPPPNPPWPTASSSPLRSLGSEKAWYCSMYPVCENTMRLAGPANVRQHLQTPELGLEIRTLRLSDLRPRALSCCRGCAIAA